MMELIKQSNSNPVQDKPLELFWREHIQLKKESGLSRAAYCRQHELICHRFAYWESKLIPKHETKSQFISVKLKPQFANCTLSQPATTLCSLGLGNGQHLKIHDVAVLPLLISLLGQ